MVFLTLFMIALLSGSLLPLGSEGVFIYDIALGYNIFTLWLVATFGNVLGALLNYYIGAKGEEYLYRKKYIKAQSLARAQKSFDRYGGFILLLSALPVIGDPLTFVAGVLHYRLRYFLFFVTLSKGGRYALLAYLYGFM
jgi:membrane protein YqaA with SNARE-associated domain